MRERQDNAVVYTFDRRSSRPSGNKARREIERAIRPQTITRKNSLFAGSEGGGRTWATLATLLQTAKMNNVDPLDWLSQTLTRIAKGWPVSEIEALMPWNFKPHATG
ncbi:transposase domain-containing protein [Rhizobium mesoamericanum]|uniref:transposase domain-containing protein n=1 Tax=Rhizobium mesoamericanum TaxID=1079800 RepID=UPI003522E766